MGTTERYQRPESFGAHFSLASRRNPHLFTGGVGYASARAALFAVLVACRPSKLHLPNFICPVVLDACAAASVPVSAYQINSLTTPTFPKVEQNELLLVINFFGLSQGLVDHAITTHGADRVIVDSAQGFFLPHRGNLATIYSPRKFLPVADGGFVRTDLALRVDPPDNAGSLHRSAYLLSRIATPPEQTREAYLDAERGLAAIGFDGMSEVTRGLAEATDLDVIRNTRRENFKRFAHAFGGINQLSMTLEDQVPLCYPLLLDTGHRLRRALLDERIFLPRFWPGVVPNPGFEEALLERALHLPVDHRYGQEDIDFLIDRVLSLKPRV